MSKIAERCEGIFSQFVLDHQVKLKPRHMTAVFISGGIRKRA